MSAVPNRALAEAERKLTLLLLEVRGTATFEQVKLYVARFTNGRLLSDYLHDDNVAPKERAALATALIEILLTKDYSRLPALEPAKAPAEATSPAVPEAATEDTVPALDEIRTMIRDEVRRELANIFDIAARVLRETPDTH